MTSETALCALCNRPMSDTAVLCFPCAWKLQDRLTAVPDLATQLQVTASRQARLGSGGRRTDASPLPDLRAADLERQLRSAVIGWAGKLTQALWPAPPATTWRDRYTAANRALTDASARLQTCRFLAVDNRAVWAAETARTAALHHHLDVQSLIRDPARWLAGHITDLRRQSWALDMSDDIHRLSRAGWRAIDRPENRFYAGPCRPVDHADPCPTVLWAKLTDTYVTCRACGTRWEVAERRAWLLRAVEDVEETAPVIASALTMMTGKRLPAATIRSWAHRDRLTSTGERDGARLYRVGDVLALVISGEPMEAKAEAVPA